MTSRTLNVTRKPRIWDFGRERSAVADQLRRVEAEIRAVYETCEDWQLADKLAQAWTLRQTLKELEEKGPYHAPHD